MKKSEVRKIYRAKRMELDDPEQMKLDDLMLIQFQSISIPFIHSMLSYWPIEENREPNTHLFTEFLRFRNPEVSICYPISNFEDGSMEAAATDIDTAFVRKDLNIHEPREALVVDPQRLDLVLLPLLAVDARGIRIGYGKGFYDRFMPRCRPDCLKIGFSYFDPVDHIDDPRDFDVPLDLCITPQTVYVF